MKVLNLFGKSMVSIVAVMATCVANAAQNGRVGMMSAATTARMPTIPVVGLTTIGNPAVTTINQPAEANLVPTPTPVPDPKPDPDPKPVPGCPDGGVENSTYTVTNCMNDILQCINTGALQGGLNDMYNEDVRNAIMGGMKLCQVHVDKCIKEVRVNCNNVYQSSADVWMDFNCSVVQPEYYNFVLRKTGLTPNQAENTCLLLDRNTYGSSFAAVSDANVVNSEYNNKVGAYNGVGGSDLSKDNPQGVAVNTEGYDGNRGHYARWDATKAECLVRVAAYNKDKLITNNWLFGAAGDNTPAEVWQKAGSTFICNKGLFNMDSLLNDTRTAAVVGVVGGTVVGTAIGAAAGAGAYNKKHNAYLDAQDKSNNPCTDAEYVKKLGGAVYTSGNAGVLKSYANESVTVITKDDGTKQFSAISLFDQDYNFNDLDEEKCMDLYLLRDKVALYQSYVNECLNNEKNKKISNVIESSMHLSTDKHTVVEEITLAGGQICIQGSNSCGVIDGSIIQQDVEEYNNKCLFVPLRIQDEASNTGVLCEHNNQCLDVNQIQYQINELNKVLNPLKSVMGEMPEDANKGKEIGKGAAIGAASGAATGAIITGITALVEKDHISCKVGDGLNSVSLGKSLTIDSLKDFYVKWNLHLPDSAVPSANGSNATYANSLEAMCFNFQHRNTPVVFEKDWNEYCHTFDKDQNGCKKASVYYETQGNLVNNACVVSGGNECILNKKAFDAAGH